MTRYAARRIDGIAQSDIRKMSRICMELGGVNLGQGICDQPTPDVVKAAAKAAIDDDRSIYSKYEGIDALRAAIARKLADYNGLVVDPDRELLVTAGSTGAFVAAVLAFIEEGDEVVLFSPFYGYHLNVLKLARPTIRSVTLRGADWEFDRDELAAAFSDRTKAVIVNTPCNPCGKVFTRDELGFIGELCRRHDALAITDEIYEFRPLGWNRRNSDSVAWSRRRPQGSKFFSGAALKRPFRVRIEGPSPRRDSRVTTPPLPVPEAA